MAGPVVLPQKILAVIVAVGRPHDGVDVLAIGDRLESLPGTPTQEPGGPDLSSAAVIRIWQQAYLAEVSAWESLGELEAFRTLTRGRRKFQGFGER